jgi:hypothetical protein
MKNPVLSILVADLHFSHQVPSARSVEPDWYEAQSRYLRQLKKLKDDTGATIIYAGDITDTPYLPPVTINFLLENLPPGFAVAGNHDLPNHSRKEIKRSAYWTLVQAKLLTDLRPGEPVEDGQTRLHGFPFGETIYPLRSPHSLAIDIAVIHAPIWKGDCPYVGSEKKTRLNSYKEKLRGYSVAVFGDNHIHFEHEFSHGCRVWNAGLFQRRRMDERVLRPSAGLLHEDGTISRKYFDCEEDKWIDVEEKAAHFDNGSMDSLVTELASLEDAKINFQEAVRIAVSDNTISGEIKKEVLRAISNQ